jgi:ABC-2 type transport system permease protein
MTLQEAWVAWQTIVIKDLRRILRLWIQIVLPPVITTTLYVVIVGHILGARIGLMDGVKYIEFIAPGLMMMQVITSSYSGVVSSFFSAKFQRQVDEMLVSPMSSHIMVLGHMSSGVLRGVIVGTLVAAIALFFTHLRVHSFMVIFLVAILSAAMFSLGGLINAIYAKKFDDISIIPTFVLTPLTYLGGVFYSIKLLPGAWQYVAMADPVVYIIDAFRYGFIGVSSGHLVLEFGAMFVFIAVLYGFALSLINRGVGLRE